MTTNHAEPPILSQVGGSRICSRCGEEKPFTEFSKGHARCKPCRVVIYTRPKNPRIAQRDRFPGGPWTCCRCKESKPRDEFYVAPLDKKQQYICKPCKRETFKGRDWSVYQRRRTLALKQAIREYKVQQGCADCGYNAHHAALEFDHLPEFEKSDTVAVFVGRGKAKQAWEEIAKCEVVCANCHNIRTWTRREEGISVPRVV